MNTNLRQMSLASFIEQVRPADRTVTVLDRTHPDAVYELLAEFFEAIGVEVTEARTDGGGPSNLVLLHDGETPLAVSSLDDVYGGTLGFNADRYATGTHGLEELEPPDVVTALDSVEIPAERENTFVLVQISRYIEGMAYKTGSGELHAGFQRLSRLTAERGTRKVYRRLGRTGVDLHVYGVADDAPDNFSVTVHPATTEELRNGWFVVHDGDDNDGWKAALVAEEVAPNTYGGAWTFDPETVDAVGTYLRETYHERGLAGTPQPNPESN